MRKQRVSKGIYFIPLTYLNKTYFIEFRALSYKEMIFIEELFYKGNHNLALLKAIEFTKPKVYSDYYEQINIDSLSIEFIKKIGDLIISYSEVTAEEYKKLLFSIDIHLDEQFQNDTWNCEVCKSKKLDRFRNCGYRGEQNKNPNFKLYVGKKVYTYCPIYETDKEILADAIEAYNCLENGHLPDEGGLYDQTKFFNIASFKVKEKIKEEQQKELEKLAKEQQTSSPS
jgi:hypothetical protein